MRYSTNWNADTVNTRWGKTKVCCLCSREGHYSNYCPYSKEALKLPLKEEKPVVRK